MSLLIEALFWLSASSLIIRVAPFTRACALASSPVRARRQAHRPLGKDRIIWAIRAWAQRVPWRAFCFQQGLAAQIMLRRHGVNSTLYYGAGRDEDHALIAHVWVCEGDIDLMGGEIADRFAVLASFPAPGSGAPRGAI